MHKLAFIALVILPFVGYSAGVVSVRNKSVVIRPRIVDVIMVVVIWFGAIFSRMHLGFEGFFAAITWAIFSAVIGSLVSRYGKVAEGKDSGKPGIEQQSMLRRIWSKWTAFARALSGFQNRMLLYFFYFIVVMPFAIFARFFSDPLRLRSRNVKSYWLANEDEKNNLEHMKRQF